MLTKILLFALVAWPAIARAQGVQIPATIMPPMPQEQNNTTNSVHKKVRQFAKACPECGNVCVSTNLVWNGGSNIERWGTVSFVCANIAGHQETGEEEHFAEDIRRPIKKSAPMVEVTQ